MLKLENTETFGWEAAVRGMRNPKNSWSRSDTAWWSYPDGGFPDFPHKLGENDIKLMMTLRNAGTDHRKFMRFINVTVDIIAPLYWWKEYDTYKVGTVANSCSTMHKIHEKEFALSDFSHDQLQLLEVEGDGYYDFDQPLRETIEFLNKARTMFLKTKDKRYWWQMIQLLPSSYNQRRTVQLNYEVLANIYKSRKDHKLDEWHTFCDWIRSLPYSKIITGDEYNESKT